MKSIITHYTKGKSTPTAKSGIALSYYTLLFIMLLFAVSTHERVKVWRGPLTLWMDVAQKSPHKARPYNGLGTAYFDQGRLDEAITEFTHAIAIGPNYPMAHCNLGNAYNNKGQIEEAIVEYKRAIAIDPNNPKVHNNLGEVLFKKGKVDEGIEYFKKCLVIEPDHAAAYNNLAWIYATSPNSTFCNATQAVSLATKACELTDFKKVEELDTLAAAYAEAGNFDKAIEYQNRAIYLSKKEAKPALLKRLALYQAGLAYRSQ